MCRKQSNTPMILPQGFTVTAHTGSMGTKDNSPESLQVGLQNAAVAEVDISVAADGTLVLFHGSTPPKDAMALEAAFRMLAQYPDKRMNLDLKVFTHCGALQRLAEDCGVLEQVFFTGVFKGETARVHADAPKIPYYLNVDINPLRKYKKEYALHLVRLVERCGAVGLNCNHMNASPNLVRTFHEHGLLVSIWTVRNERQLQRVLRLAPDNMTTVMPDRVNAVLAQIR